jgi:hypothetical protein
MRNRALAVAVLALAGCGGHSKDRLGLRTPGEPPNGAPAHAARSGPPVTAAEVAVIRGWSEALRHGHVVAAARHFVIATFKLTDRPGGGCGSGAGDLASTAFLIRRNHISQWLRVPTQPADNKSLSSS